MNKPKKLKKRSKNPKKYVKPVSLWPLKPEDALKSFMQVDREKIKV